MRYIFQHRLQRIRVRTAVAIHRPTEEMLGGIGQKELIRRCCIALQGEKYPIHSRLIVRKNALGNSTRLAHMLIHKLHRIIGQFAQITVHRHIRTMDIRIQYPVMQVHPLAFAFICHLLRRCIYRLLKPVWFAFRRKFILRLREVNPVVTVRPRRSRFSTAAQHQNAPKNTVYLNKSPHFAAKLRINFEIRKFCCKFARRNEKT